LAAANAYGFQNPMTTEEKTRNRDLIIKQNTWTKKEQQTILDYCAKDVLETEHVYYGIVNDLEKYCGNDFETLLWEAQHRGQSMACLQKIQDNGIPIDTPLINDFNTYWDKVKEAVIKRFNKKLNLWDESCKFSNDKFEVLIRSLNLFDEWPRTPTGKLKTNSETLELFKDYPKIKLLKRVNNLLNSTKLAEYIVSEDGRLRPFGGYNMFGTHTGRTTPSSKWIFGTAKWGRNFIRAGYGSAVVYLDFKSEEVFVAARLSGDKNLMEAYMTGDCYIGMAMDAGLAPKGATKATHPVARIIFKVITLAANYLMGARSISKKLKQFNYTYSQSKRLLFDYKEKYSTYFNWNKNIRSAAAYHGKLSTSLGWDRRFAENKLINHRSIANWPIQAESAEILRNAMIRLTDAHIKVCAPIHDAFLIECTVPEMEDQIRVAKNCMIEAAEYVLGDPHNIGGRMMVDHQVHHENFKQDAADQEIFDLIFEEINKYKKSLPILKRLEHNDEDGRRGAYIIGI